MKRFSFFLLSFFFLISYNIFSQCDLPQPYTGNTGSNMTVFFTSGAIDALSISSNAPYVVAISPDGLIVGSASLASVDLIGGQQSVAVWADDTATPELDGALAGDLLTFQLVDGNSLYDLNLTFAGLNSFVANGQLPVILLTSELNCSDSDLSNPGCTDTIAFNYNSSANVDDGSCYPVIYGCLDQTAFNFNDYDFDGLSNVLTGVNGVDVNTSNGVCIQAINGCTDPNAYNFSQFANSDDGTCIAVLEGCTDETAFNYNPNANVADGSCIAVIEGCIDETAFNYNPNANLTDGSCIAVIEGCINDWADNYDSNATTDDGSCVLSACISNWADNYDSNATTDDGSCVLSACMSDWADNYDSNATIDDGSCVLSACMSDWADNYDSNATTDDGSCVLSACMSDWADNYDPNATSDDSSCDRLGCISEIADNYDALATSDDGSCLFTGCMNPDADNYNPQANVIAYCQFLGCTNLSSLNYDSSANEDDGSCIAVVQSCINPVAYNYNPNANEDDGSCLFNQNHVDSLANYYIYFLNQYNTVVHAANLLSAQLELADPSSYGQIELNLIPGWNMVGYNIIQPTDIVSQFEPIEDDIRLVKDNFGFIYWPQFGYNGIGDLIPGQGYQLRMDQSRTFHFVNTDQRRAISPTIPDWAIDMETEIHPNDVRTLAKVVNMLGQEVNVNEVTSGTILLYLFNDGSVEKKLH